MKEKYTVEKVYENIKIEDGIYKLTIKGKFNVKPGQFYLLRAWDVEPVLSRPISVHFASDEEISFLYAVVGKGTKILSQLKTNDEIKITGPLGNGFDVDKVSGKVAIVCGGIGIAPMVYLASQLKKCDVDFYAGFKTMSKTVDNVEKYVNNLKLSTEDGSIGHKGYVTDLLNPENYDMVLCCGPEVMMYKVIKMCQASKTPVYVSMEKKMACGIGACLVCTCKTKSGRKRTCKEGPVFLGSELILND
ncbi:dihydroorotate dehydrogenase electron transfer subunit [Clostridium guangxiense]|uniref:dihydroorotate dehydrogenase electron transfer subunit n=1 Tax=Clostridium guangxiense TaxID=1662055 RepID=UPI001E296027|nr:dihydroorotate dehydrogenase electron transfer subunit [Clostridium guangxiense]MCD2347266.1 dihydroorotate dehydrogenase electron transfer subunit [Clostridium guangxiense]